MSSEKTKTPPTVPASGCRVLRKFASVDQADAASVTVTLFRNARHETCGWFIGPLRVCDGRFVLPFLPQSVGTMASLAIIRALEAATEGKHPVCLIDPENLWETVWHR